MNNESNQRSAGWYAPMQETGKQPAAETRPAVEKKKRGLSPAWRIMLSTLVVVGLITASSLIFRDDSPAQ